MYKSEIKIKRRDLLTVPQAADLLREMADQLDAGHTLTLDGLPIILANQVLVRRQYRKEGGEHLFELKIDWRDDMEGHSEVAGDPEEDGQESEGDDLPETGVPRPPLDLPGPDNPARMREE